MSARDLSVPDLYLCLLVGLLAPLCSCQVVKSGHSDKAARRHYQSENGIAAGVKGAALGNKPPEGKAERKKALEKSEGSPEGWMSLFHAPPTPSEGRGREKQMIQPSEEPESSATQLRKARQLLAIGKPAQSELLYRRILQDDPGHQIARLELAMALIRRKKTEDASELLEAIRIRIEGGKNHQKKGYVFKFKYILALNYLLSARRKQAHQILTDLIRQDKTFTPGYAALASSYYLTGKYKISEFIVRQGMDRGPDNEALFNLMGLLEQKKGHDIKAIFWFDKSLALNAKFTPAMINKASLALKKFHYNDAKRFLKKSISIDPSSSDSYIVLSALYMEQKRPKEATALLEKVLQAEPQNIWARYHMGLVTLYGMNKPFRALRYFAEVAQNAGYGEDGLRDASRDLISDIKNSAMIRQ